LRDVWADTLQRTARRLYGATEGQIIIDKFLFWSNGPNCKACESSSGTTTCGLCFGNFGGTGQTTLFDHSSVSILTWNDHPLWVHELVHLYWGLADEYSNGSAGLEKCGHSIMANHGLADQTNLCTDLNHGRDYDPSAPAATGKSAHRVAYEAGRSALPSTFLLKTPDNYSFDEFDFNGAVGIVVHMD